jgi:exopolysaccharide biosynthesis protein
MTRTARNIVILGLSFGVILAGLTGYNLYDTFVAEHEATAEYLLDSSSSGTTSLTSTNSGSGTSASSDSSRGSESTSTNASPYAKTAVSLVNRTAKNDNGVTSKYYIADIELHSYDDLKTHLTTSSGGSPGANYTQKMMSHISSIESAGESPLVAINGDSAYYSKYRNGYVIRNGLKYRSTQQTTSGSQGVTSGDGFAIYKDGGASTYVETTTTTTELLANNCYQCFCFGPTLYENSTIQVSEDQDVSQCKGANQRTAIGFIDNYHFVFFVSEGRINGSSADGFSLYEVAGLLKDYGCVRTYNLDGGGASYMWYGGSRVNASSEDRAVGDILYVKAS